MDRRTFLGQAMKHLAFGSLLMGGGPGGLLLSQARAAATGRTLVVVFLRGGCDGLNMLVPHGEDAYYSLRPTLGIAPPSAGNPLSALNLDGFFGLHPSMAALHGLYQNGWVAALPAVHYPSASRSHFVGQDIIENATALPSTTGWLGRYLATLSGAEQKAFALTVGVPRSLLGSVPVSAIADLSSLSLAATKADQGLLAAMMASEYSRAPIVGHPYDAGLRAAGRQLQIDIAELQNVNALPTANGAAYPATPFGRQMRQAAGLIKTRPGTELLALDLGGWDHHRAQGGGQPDGAQAKLLNQLSEATAAFYADLGSAASGVLLLAVTEFGRTAAENSSGGTDHGNASSWLAVGPMVNGGVHSVAGWPGLAPTQLDEGRYLAQSTDYRDIYGEILSRHLGVPNPSSLLAGYAAQTVGFL
ncbi:MAG: hypothetical protein B7Z35_14695 [Hydrogenophilales bacterium 12-61-10]|nr:MAG: hypothetical protein B7Z35_14695 [Hydrogenophilales bacterium 12-61-10]